MKCVILDLKILSGMLFMSNPKSFVRHFLSHWAHLLLARLFAYLILDFLSWRLRSILGLGYFEYGWGGESIAVNAFPSPANANSL